MPPKKKAPKHQSEKKHKVKEIRRAYEHMGRVSLLQQIVPAAQSSDIETLVSAAQEALSLGEEKDAAELLRAAEHLCFASAKTRASDKAKLSDKLIAAITEHFHDLGEKADEHWAHEGNHESTIAHIYVAARRKAVEAMKAKHYHQALESIRAAESLAHVKHHEAKHLELKATEMPKLTSPKAK